MLNKKNINLLKLAGGLALLLVVLWGGAGLVRAQARGLSVAVSRAQVERGEAVEVTVRATGAETVRAALLTPSTGARELSLRKTADGVYQTSIKTGENSPAGLYLVHAWTGEQVRPAAVAKSSFRVGNIVADFFIANYVDKDNPGADLDRYLKDFRSIGGNFLIAHNLIIAAKAFYPSKIAKTDVAPGSEHDLVEQLLTRADREGFSVLLSVGWDVTRTSPYKDRMNEIKAIVTELYGLYRHHPSLAGFYSWQEGSGTYYAPYVREFSEHVKSHEPGLLTACAPHIDDPLLASYLSVIDELDVLIYQSAVMGSYRTDNRKKYPWRRVRDFAGLGAGARRLQNKITLTHVEVFGYLEKRISPDHVAASYEDIYGQILSAATVTDTDGVSLFAYHAHLYDPAKKGKQVQRSRAGVVDGLSAYQLLTAEITRRRNPVALYVPYSDFVIERWNNYFLPALDAFRVLGFPVDILPYAPRIDESIYPYYPIHHNPDVLERLLSEKNVLVLANVSGFQQTDSDLIKPFLERGGVIVAFGPQIPMGRTFERRELFGLDETPAAATHTAVVVKEALGSRVKTGQKFALTPTPRPVWTADGARVIATFDDGSPAVTVKNFGKGTAVTILLSAEAAAQLMPDLVRDALAHALSLTGRQPLVDILGSREAADVAAVPTANGFRVAFVNHEREEREIVFRPVRPPGRGLWLDLATGQKIETAAADQSLTLKIPGVSFRALEFRAAAVR